jgi:hypothetical protein
MNAPLAKPIQQDLAYSEMAVDVDRWLAAMQPWGADLSRQ